MYLDTCNDDSVFLNYKTLSPKVFQCLENLVKKLFPQDRYVIITFNIFEYKTLVLSSKNENSNILPTHFIVPSVTFVCSQKYYVLGSIFFRNSYHSDKPEKFSEDIADCMKLYIKALYRVNLRVVASVSPPSLYFKDALAILSKRDQLFTHNYLSYDVKPFKKIIHFYEPGYTSEIFCKWIICHDIHFQLKGKEMTCLKGDILKLFQEWYNLELRENLLKKPNCSFAQIRETLFNSKTNEKLTDLIREDKIKIGGTTTLINNFSKIYNLFFSNDLIKPSDLYNTLQQVVLIKSIYKKNIALTQKETLQNIIESISHFMEPINPKIEDINLNKSTEDQSKSSSVENIIKSSSKLCSKQSSKSNKKKGKNIKSTKTEETTQIKKNKLLNMTKNDEKFDTNSITNNKELNIKNKNQSSNKFLSNLKNGTKISILNKKFKELNACANDENIKIKCVSKRLENKSERNELNIDTSKNEIEIENKSNHEDANDSLTDLSNKTQLKTDNIIDSNSDHCTNKLKKKSNKPSKNVLNEKNEPLSDCTNNLHEKGSHKLKIRDFLSCNEIKNLISNDNISTSCKHLWNNFSKQCILDENSSKQKNTSRKKDINGNSLKQNIKNKNNLITNVQKTDLEINKCSNKENEQTLNVSTSINNLNTSNDCSNLPNENKFSTPLQKINNIDVNTSKGCDINLDNSISISKLNLKNKPDCDKFKKTLPEKPKNKCNLSSLADHQKLSIPVGFISDDSDSDPVLDDKINDIILSLAEDDKAITEPDISTANFVPEEMEWEPADSNISNYFNELSCEKSDEKGDTSCKQIQDIIKNFNDIFNDSKGKNEIQSAYISNPFISNEKDNISKSIDKQKDFTCDKLEENKNPWPHKPKKRNVEEDGIEMETFDKSKPYSYKSEFEKETSSKNSTDTQIDNFTLEELNAMWISNILGLNELYQDLRLKNLYSFASTVLRTHHIQNLLDFIQANGNNFECFQSMVNVSEGCKPVAQRQCFEALLPSGSIMLIER